MRRLSFGIKDIAAILNGSDVDLHATIAEKIQQNSTALLEAKETDQLLRTFAAQLAKMPLDAVNVTDVLSNFIYLSNKTREMIPMEQITEKCRVAISPSMVAQVCEGEVNLLTKIKDLRAEKPDLPMVRIIDMKDLANEAVIYWDGKEVWRKKYAVNGAAGCADEIIEEMRKL